MKRFLPAVLLLSTSLVAATTAEPQRLITIGGCVSETVCALGLCDRIVATDSSSLYPEVLTKRPQVGYSRALNAEGLLSQKSDLILAVNNAGPDKVLQSVKNAGTKVSPIDSGTTVDAAKNRIKEIGGVLNRNAEATALVQSMEHDLQTLQSRRAAISNPEKVLFIYARGNKVLQVSGEHTGAATMIELAGARNAVTGFSEYRNLTAEAAVAAAPTVILMTRDGLSSVGGNEGVWKLPGLSMTPAFGKKRLIVMDDLYLLGMGPRLGQAGLQLMDELYPHLPKAAAPLSRK
jgi:iron complex transport system substrate-binding protein